MSEKLVSWPDELMLLKKNSLCKKMGNFVLALLEYLQNKSKANGNCYSQFRAT